jgi:uncharacterized protein YcfL
MHERRSGHTNLTTIKEFFMKTHYKCWLLIALFVISGCASEQSQKSNLTAGMVNTKIIKGVTTQTEVLDVFGAPNIITKNKSGNEVWTYDRVAIETSASESYGTIILAGISKTKGGVSSRTFTLMLEFDDDQTVSDYSYRSSTF